MNTPILSFDEIVDKLRKMSLTHQEEYLSMYSSWYGGIIKDKSLMLIPIDDHMVHRGDGIFEAFKCVNGNIYQFGAHLQRMQISLDKIKLSPPFSIEEIKKIVTITIREGGEKNCIVRIYISRGPGDFSPKPKNSIGSQLYVVVTKIESEDKKRDKGCSLKLSKIPIKDPFFATIKSCNYLQNVLMEMECMEYGVDYVVNVKDGDKIGEGPTENFGIITREDEFIIPPFEGILKGTTVLRAFEFAKEMVKQGILQNATIKDVYIKDLKDSKEILVFGTTMDVLPITKFEDHPVGDGKPGKFYKLFFEKFIEDQKKNKEVLTPVW